MAYMRTLRRRCDSQHAAESNSLCTPPLHSFATQGHDQLAFGNRNSATRCHLS